MRTFNRRQLLAGGAAATAFGLTRSVLGQGVPPPGAFGPPPGAFAPPGAFTPARGTTVPVQKRVRIAVLTPARTGLSTVRTSINDYPGEGARSGVLIGDSVFGPEVEAADRALELLHSNTPTADAAKRAVERIVATGRPTAIIGGIGDGQAEAIARVAEAAKVPFFNVGNSTDALRHACNRYTFHVESSAAMYLDVMAQWAAANGKKKPFVIHENTPNGNALLARFRKAVERHGAGATVVGSAVVKPEQPVYFNEMNAMSAVGADLIVLMINAVDQIAFLAQQESVDMDIESIVFPDLISQTRDYISSVRAMAPLNNPRIRFASWDSSAIAHGAEAFNDRFHARFSEPADPTAWAAFASVRMITQAALKVGTQDSTTMVRYLEEPATTFEVGKGPGISFRPWDHQLRQPIYHVKIDQDIEWVRTDYTTWVGLGSVDKETPAAVSNVGDLDRFGDTAADMTCRR